MKEKHNQLCHTGSIARAFYYVFQIDKGNPIDNQHESNRNHVMEMGIKPIIKLKTASKGKVQAIRPSAIVSKSYELPACP